MNLWGPSGRSSALATEASVTEQGAALTRNWTGARARRMTPNGFLASLMPLWAGRYAFDCARLGRWPEQLGVDRGYISDMERGKKNVCLPTLEVIAKGVGLQSRRS